jgi:hypothetical protein
MRGRLVIAKVAATRSGPVRKAAGRPTAPTANPARIANPNKTNFTSFPLSSARFHWSSQPDPIAEDVLYRKLMVHLGETAHRVLRRCEMISRLVGSARCRLDAEICCDSAEYNGLDTPAPQLLVKD